MFKAHVTYWQNARAFMNSEGKMEQKVQRENEGGKIEDQQGDVVDIEQCATRGETPPKAPRYRIRVDQNVYVVHGPTITGRGILEVSHHVPPQQWRLDQRF